MNVPKMEGIMIAAKVLLVGEGLTAAQDVVAAATLPCTSMVAVAVTVVAFGAVAVCELPLSVAIRF
jgi:hypothetical protein